jgi:transcriptional repressor NrdR
VRCPFCQHGDDKVVDSREAADGDSVRRRRECLACGRRFTTYERIDVVMPMLVKKDGCREPWNREKLSSGIRRACEKRPVSADAIEEAVVWVERRAQEAGSREVDSSTVGEAVMDCLKNLDDVAYVRFSSVYKSFRDIDEFVAAVEKIASERRGGKVGS